MARHESGLPQGPRQGAFPRAPHPDDACWKGRKPLGVIRTWHPSRTPVTRPRNPQHETAEQPHTPHVNSVIESLYQDHHGFCFQHAAHDDVPWCRGRAPSPSCLGSQGCWDRDGKYVGMDGSVDRGTGWIAWTDTDSPEPALVWEYSGSELLVASPLWVTLPATPGSMQVSTRGSVLPR